MDLHILITDENGDTMYDAQVYQDGSDSEGANKIADFIERNFEIEEVHRGS